MAVCHFETVSFADRKVPQSLLTGCINDKSIKLEILVRPKICNKNWNADQQ